MLTFGVRCNITRRLPIDSNTFAEVSLKNVFYILHFYNMVGKSNAETKMSLKLGVQKIF